MHGALLRLARPSSAPFSCRSYLVAQRFSKRADAKAAVCIQAMAEGAGAYIRELAKEVDARLSPLVRRNVNDTLLPAILTELKKVRPDAAPAFEFKTESDGEHHTHRSLGYNSSAYRGTRALQPRVAR